MTDHNQRSAGRLKIGEQQIEKGGLVVTIQRRSGFICNDQLGRADQRARRRDPLLLPDTQV